MNTRNFEVLYTHQKLKKAKTWQDGCLKISCNGTKAVLSDEQGCSLEIFHIHSHKIFPGNDIECERYLISIGDEKISEERIGNISSTSNANCANSSRYGANNNQGSKFDLGSTLGKRKREVQDTFRPDLPQPRQDSDPAEIRRFNSDYCSNEGINKDMKYNQFPASASAQNNFLPRRCNHETVTNFEGLHEKKASYHTTLEYNQHNPTTESSVNKFNSLNDYQKTIALNSKGLNLKEDMGNYVNIHCRPSSSRGENRFLDSQRSSQASSYENCLPTQKRNRSELLSLFGGKNRVVSDPQKESSSVHETITPPQPKFSTFNNSENISHKKPLISYAFSETFDISLDDNDDFLDTSFSSLCNPERQTIPMSNAPPPPWLRDQPWRSDEAEVIDVDDGREDIIEYPHIETFIPDDNNAPGINTLISETPRLYASPWESNEPQVTTDDNALIREHFDEELDGVDFDNDYEDFEMLNTFSESSRSSAGHEVERKHQHFLHPGTRMNSTCTPDRKRGANSQVCADKTVLVNRRFNPELDDPVFDYGDCGVGLAMFNPSSERSTFVEGEEANNQPSITNIFVPTHLTSTKKNKFNSPLITSVSKNPHESSSNSEENVKSCNIERASIGSSVRPQSFSGELYFPSKTECCESVTPTRHVTIPTKFSSAMDYKSILKSTLREHLNIILFNMAQKYHGVLGKADIGLTTDDDNSGQKENFKGPSCSHGPAKLRAVKKDGPNKGRHFYTCPGSGSNQCKFFQWADQSQTTSAKGSKKISLTSSDSIRMFFKSEGIYFYHNCLIERRSRPKKFFGKKHFRKGSNMDSGKKVMYLVLKYRDSSSLYTKDDIWIISKTINFEPSTTFVAKSSFYGPSSSGDLEIEPLSGYSQSNWRSGDTVHAIWACNAGSELSCIQNLDEHVTLQQMPLLPFLLNGSHPSYSSQRCQRHAFSSPLSVTIDRNSLGISWQVIQQETEKMMNMYNLNDDQAIALRSCAKMFVSENEENLGCLPITLIHGVFGAGKSFLLAVVVLLMVKLFEIAKESDEAGASSITWKILISSTTNVAVDRILLGLLELGFDQFVRVGSVKKIAKPVLPFSIHSIGTESQELKELQGLLKTELTSSEKAYVRKSIEMHKLGENRKRLADVRVVGVTCAACSFAALERLKFPVLLLDECSQMTEPTSLLPMARFGCRKLVLVGDPKQLNPTIQGSEPSHESGLEQTLFDRLLKMDLQPTLLRTQYRCHPVISSVSNRLFYNGQLLDGVAIEDRQPLVDFIPTLCFYNVCNGKEECSQDGSFFNTAEATFVVVLIKSLLESEVEPKQIGVITQYKSQLTAIRNTLLADGETSSKELAGIQISTVDAFQGGEKDVIILSCVRTKHIGFIDCERRTNVALTRAKRHLCIVGCGKILSSNSLWSKIITSCRESPGGFQSSESYIKDWNERRPKPQEIAARRTSTKPKKPRKSRKNKTTSKSCDETASKEASSVSTINNSSQIHTLLGSHSSSHSSSEVEEIFRSAPTTDYEEVYHENMHDHTAEMTANGEALVIGDNATAIKNSEAFEISDDHVQHIDKCNRIEISDDDDDDDDKSFDDVPDDVPDNGDCGDEHENPTKIEINLTENRTDISQGNSLDLMFEDDSIIDDELRYLGL